MKLRIVCITLTLAAAACGSDNGGDVLDGKSLEQKGEEIFEKILSVASGEKSKSELLGYGDNEFVPWQIGATF